MDNKETNQHFANSMFGPSDEEKETCIHCGKTWYAIHHKDGVCHECQAKKLPGRTQMARTERLIAIIVRTVVIAIIIVFLCALYFAEK